MDWQPIETTEKTTKARLIWIPERQSSFAATWNDGAYGGQKGWHIFGGEWREFLQRPTHWMPLPAPPAV